MNRLKKIRKEKNLTLIDLSKKLGIPRATLSRYENGTSEPKQETWDQIAKFFEVSVGYLMGISDEKLDDEKILNVARKVFSTYLSNENLSEETKKAIDYFNNENLDNVLSQEMRQYLSAPFVVESEQLSSLDNFGYLHFWLESRLVERYRDEVKTNQNMITNIYYSIPDEDSIYSYADIPNEVQLPITEELKKILIEIDFSDEFNEDLEKLIKSNTTLISSNYESSVDNKLKDEINIILNETRTKLKSLKQKYPDRPSDIQQKTFLISSYDKKNLAWSRIGDKDYEDELEISESTKQMFINLASDILKHKDSDNTEQ